MSPKRPRINRERPDGMEKNGKRKEGRNNKRMTRKQKAVENLDTDRCLSRIFE